MTDSIPVSGIAELPYWRVSERPSEYRGDRIATASECLDLLEAMSVRSGGWRYPFVSRRREGIRLRSDHVEVFTSSGEIQEFARMYRSGQYLYVTTLREAYHPGALEEARELARILSADEAPGVAVSIVRLMRLVSVAFLNAKALIERLNLNGALSISMRLANVRGAVLVAGEPRRSLDELYRVDEGIVDYDRQYDAARLTVEPLETAVEAAKHFFAVFGWRDPAEFVLRGLQEEALT
jgi:hypothetical protein